MSISKKIALVVGWGSVKCAAALGLLRVLGQAGVEVSLIVASGGGSIFGSLVALGHTVDEIVALNERLWTHAVTQKTNRLAVLQLLLPQLFPVRRYFNLRDDQLVNARLREALGEHTFADTRLPLFITATDYTTGQQVVLSSGSLYQAVRASVALPLIFPPVEQGGRLLADGYLSDPLPIGVALQEGADIILALGFESVSTAARHNMGDYLLHLSGLLSNNLLLASCAFYSLAHHAEIFLILPQFEENIHMFDTRQVPAIIRAGEIEGEKLLPKLQRLLETPA
jgi:NTE family protein